MKYWPYWNSNTEDIFFLNEEGEGNTEGSGSGEGSAGGGNAGTDLNEEEGVENEEVVEENIENNSDVALEEQINYTDTLHNVEVNTYAIALILSLFVVYHVISDLFKGVFK